MSTAGRPMTDYCECCQTVGEHIRRHWDDPERPMRRTNDPQQLLGVIRTHRAMFGPEGLSPLTYHDLTEYLAALAPAFTRIVAIERSDSGTIRIVGKSDSFDLVVRDDNWEIEDGPVKGWGEWTHCIYVQCGPRKGYYFVR